MVSTGTEGGVGTRFGKFLLLKKLAAGGMGEIFLAKQSGPVGFEKILVIKRILQHHLDNQQYVDMFFSEARTAAMLSHSNVVQVYDMGEVDEHFYIAMEYVHGRSLKEVVSRASRRHQTIPLAYIADLIAQAAAGLSYSHNLRDAAGQPVNIIHRDINPHNLLVSYNGDLKIIDFGIAKSTMSVNKTETGTIKGKFVYMSPEQSAAEVLDKRSDIFSLAIVLYEMLAGVNPFQRDNIVLSLEAIQRKDPPAITAHRADAACFEPILRKGLAKDRAQRYADCNDMRDDLLRLIDARLVPRPDVAIGTWLETLFADLIDEDRQVLLETGSGISRAAPRLRAGGLAVQEHTEALSTPSPRPAPRAIDDAAPTAGLDVAEVEAAIADVFAQSGPKQQPDMAAELAAYHQGTDGATVREGHRDEETRLLGEAEPAVEGQAERTVRYDTGSGVARRFFDSADGASMVEGLEQVEAEAPRRRWPVLAALGGVLVALVLILVFALRPATGDAAAVVTGDPRAILDAGVGGALPPVDPLRPLPPLVVDAARANPDAAQAVTPDATPSADSARAALPDAARPDTARPRPVDAGAPAATPRKPPDAPPAVARPDPPPAKRKPLGSLVVNPGPNLSVEYLGRGGTSAQTYKLRKDRGRIVVRGGPAAISLNLDFQIVDDSVKLRVDSSPWAVVGANGINAGRTPQSLEADRRFSLELKNPSFGQPIRVMVIYRPD